MVTWKMKVVSFVSIRCALLVIFHTVRCLESMNNCFLWILLPHFTYNNCF